MATQEDTLQPLITQCPNCDAQFRVTENQLQVAGGKVRCGACLSVFDATQHLLVDGEQIASTSEQDPNNDVDALLEELDELDGVPSHDAEQTPTQNSEPTDSVIPPSPLPGETEQPALETSGVSQTSVPPSEDSDSVSPEFAALEAQFLNELRGGDVSTETTTHADPLHELPEAERTHESADDQVAPAGAESATESAAEVREVKSDVELGTDLEDSVEITAQSDAQAAARTDAPQDAVSEVGAEPAHTEPVAAGAVSETVKKEGPEGIPIIEALVADAELEGPAKPGRRSWTTLALIVLGVIAIPAQVLWFQFDAWSKDDTYRPIYKSICTVLGCELPTMMDLTLLERREFHMRHHPDSDNAYIFDLLIVNTADFAQPYPVIELVATTERGSLVAGRRFKPVEYLHGEVKPTDLMPPRTPVHISLEIEHPGHPNLKFQTNFRPSQ